MGLLEYLSDECPKITKAVLEMAVPNREIEFALPSFPQLYGLSDIYVPVSLPEYCPL